MANNIAITDESGIKGDGFINIEVNKLSHNINQKDYSIKEIRKVAPDSMEALKLMDKLSDALEAVTGNSGRSSFDAEDVKVPRSLFIVAYNLEGEAVGCGAIRPMDENIAEVKRMYAKYKGSGIGSIILSFLEKQAVILGFSALRLETRLINEKAVFFYEARGYLRIQNYGKYYGNKEAVCFEKILN